MDFRWDISDTATFLLVSVNVIQMIIILVLLLPIIDIVILSKHIKNFTDSIKNSPLTISLLLGYGFIVIFYGILSPTKILTELKHSKQAREGETPEEILRRIITSTNASRNYILGAFSLFYLLVIIRLFDFVTFSAKLYEFSELMANYDLVDIALIEESDYVSTTPSLIDDIIEEQDEDVPWPIRADFNKAERSQIRTFLRDPPKKLAVLAKKAKDYKSSLEKDPKNKSGTDTEVTSINKGSKETINAAPNTAVENIFEITPKRNLRENIERINSDQEINGQEGNSHQKKEDKKTAKNN